jgi:hypothetical protein
MPIRRAFAPMLPEFDSFLFALVGEEVDGVQLSVLSALSRLELDPRDEAARLSHLTKEVAADQLAKIIARLSDRHRSLSEARSIAGRLVECLPMSTNGDKPDQYKTGAESTPGSSQSSFLVYLALAIALVVGFIANGFLSFG